MPGGAFLPALLLLAFAGVAWWHNLRAREVALAAGRRACEAQGLQFLDETVAFARYRLRRDERGSWRLQRTYAFDFSAPDQERGSGWIRMLGPRVVTVQLEREDGTSDYEATH
ncbi:MAG TPA: DUF3301 domain-containing protein [Gammaproteobacteria bacterium]|nr:DUF3301 domain-containing protein [Gammaproteobacteria bacterium]